VVILREDPAARFILIALIILAINVIILGELYLLAVLLGGRGWLLKLAKVALGLFYLSMAGVFGAFFLASFVRVQLFVVPGLPSRAIAQETALYSLFPIYGMTGSIFYSLARRLAGLQPKLRGPMPPVMYRRLLYTVSIGLGIGLILGLLFGALLGGDTPGIFSLPLLHWLLATPILGICLIFAAYLGGVIAYNRHIQWRLERLAPARFRSVGIWLMLAGSLVLGAAFWLAP